MSCLICGKETRPNQSWCGKCHLKVYFLFTIGIVVGGIFLL
jgi:hypothetical protein